jgi:hypothetical protein
MEGPATVSTAAAVAVLDPASPSVVVFETPSPTPAQPLPSSLSIETTTPATNNLSIPPAGKPATSLPPSGNIITASWELPSSRYASSFATSQYDMSFFFSSGDFTSQATQTTACRTPLHKSKPFDFALI